MEAYRAFMDLKEEGMNVYYHCPPVDVTLKFLLSQIKLGKSYEFMYFVYPKEVRELMHPYIYRENKYNYLTKQEFNKNPKLGVLVYKNENNVLIFEKYEKKR